MVERQIAARGVRDKRVLEAMRNVPRHWFVPWSAAQEAYDDSPLRIGHGQTISQPYIVALMTELLELKPSDKVLEIGTGSGYQAAVLAELADQVYTIEIIEPLGRKAMATLKERGYRNVHVRIGDGYQGWPEEAPFDAIIVTCAPESPPPPLVEQLAIGGRMCIPVGPEWGTQHLIQLRKGPDGTLERKRVEWVRFVPMTGKAQNKGGD
jgi:protein-L-isoaspartate(D-aspartate) O-methyltransferase